MVFIRKKQVKGNLYYYLVETLNRRQKNIKYLGKQIPNEMRGLWHKNKK